MKLKQIEAEALAEIQAEEVERRKVQIQELYKQKQAAWKVYNMLDKKYQVLMEEEI